MNIGFRHGLAVGVWILDILLEWDRGHTCHPFSEQTTSDHEDLPERNLLRKV
jgi:hypothetical protein